MADDTKICPKCAESVRSEAKVCRHCGHAFGSQDASVEAAPAKKGGMLKKGLGCLGIAIVLLILVAIFAPEDSSETPATNDVAATTSDSDATEGSAADANQEAPAGTEAGLTQANFERVRDGMTVDQVAAILGSPGEKVSESAAGGSTMTVHQWKGGMLSGRAVIGTFDNGKLMSKTQVGL